mmetsp:Transcript_6954/g.17191  ORF Transcript_6954/g.17191 Transcript_6954/m.17191 type:complete len:93 (-) Transcript_6954:109-387(-)
MDDDNDGGDESRGKESFALIYWSVLGELWRELKGVATLHSPEIGGSENDVYAHQSGLEEEDGIGLSRLFGDFDSLSVDDTENLDDGVNSCGY